MTFNGFSFFVIFGRYVSSLYYGKSYNTMVIVQSAFPFLNMFKNGRLFHGCSPKMSPKEGGVKDFVMTVLITKKRNGEGEVPRRPSLLSKIA